MMSYTSSPFLSASRKEGIKTQVRRLFDGSQYVFCAAAINSGVDKFIFAMANDSKSNYNAEDQVSLIIGLNVGYSLVSQIFGALLIVYYPKNGVLREYLTTVATENNLFAWQKTSCLIILRWVAAAGDVKAISILAWLVVSIIALTLMFILNELRYRFTRLPSSFLIDLAKYDGESFALALAFSFTLILVVYIYSDASSNYLGGGDDVNPIDDDVSKEKNKLHVLFIIYCILVTVIVLLGDIIDIPRLLYGKVVKAKQNFNSSSLDSNLAYSPPHLNPSAPQSDSRVGVGGVTPSPTDKQRTNFSPASPNFLVEKGGTSENSMFNSPLSCCFICFCCTCTEFLDKFLGWDKSNLHKVAFFEFFQHFSAYLVVSAWYCWSALSLQTYFLDKIIGLLIFAVSVSLFFSFLLIKIDNRRKDSMRSKTSDFDAIHQSIDENLSSEKTESILLLIGQFICGWSWNCVITSLILIIIEKTDENKEHAESSDYWNKALGTTLFVFVLLTGFGIYKLKTHRNINENPAGSNYGYDNSLDIKPSSTIDNFITSPDYSISFFPGSPSENGSTDGDGSWQVYDGNKRTNKSPTAIKTAPFNQSKSQLQVPLL